MRIPELGPEDAPRRGTVRRWLGLADCGKGGEPKSPNRMAGRQKGVSGLTYLSLQGADEQALQNLARLVAVADVLKGLGRVLAADVQQDLFTTAIVVASAPWRLAPLASAAALAAPMAGCLTV